MTGKMPAIVKERGLSDPADPGWFGPLPPEDSHLDDHLLVSRRLESRISSTLLLRLKYSLLKYCPSQVAFDQFVIIEPLVEGIPTRS